jgi:hypothetical protein
VIEGVRDVQRAASVYRYTVRKVQGNRESWPTFALPTSATSDYRPDCAINSDLTNSIVLAVRHIYITVGIDSDSHGGTRVLLPKLARCLLRSLSFLFQR